MLSISKLAGPFIAGLCLCVLGCTFPTRTGYDRNIGDYKPVPASETAASSAPPGTDQASNPQAAAKKDSPKRMNSAAKARNAINKKEVAKAQERAKPRGNLENYARGWMGAKYVYGAASKNKTDCSGFVMQVYKGYYKISLDHNASKMYKDSRGKSVSRGSLKEGDLVFFGSLWRIDHVGIYLSGDRFIHASSSRGVMISPMHDKYWGPKYQGARRFK